MITTRIPLLLVVLLLQAVTEKALEPVLDFAGPDTSRQWQAVNDGVMGGVSDGRFRITDENTLAFFGHARKHNIGPAEVDALRKWALLANAKGRYTRGSSETLLDQDLATIRDGGGVQDLLDRLRMQVGRLDIAPEELEGRNQRSTLFKTMFLAFRDAGAKDWISNLAIGLDHKGATHKLQFHHIYPKAVLKKHYTAREADDVANLSFISEKTNRKILAKAPKAYLPEYIEKAGHKAFQAQCIPIDQTLLDVGDYKTFLVERRRLISERLNEFLGVAGAK
jgi:hypothetical protein